MENSCKLKKIVCMCWLNLLLFTYSLSVDGENNTFLPQNYGFLGETRVKKLKRCTYAFLIPSYSINSYRKEGCIYTPHIPQNPPIKPSQHHQTYTHHIPFPSHRSTFPHIQPNFHHIKAAASLFMPFIPALNRDSFLLSEPPENEMYVHSRHRLMKPEKYGKSSISTLRGGCTYTHHQLVEFPSYRRKESHRKGVSPLFMGWDNRDPQQPWEIFAKVVEAKKYEVDLLLGSHEGAYDPLKIRMEYLQHTLNTKLSEKLRVSAKAGEGSGAPPSSLAKPPNFSLAADLKRLSPTNSNPKYRKILQFDSAGEVALTMAKTGFDIIFANTDSEHWGGSVQDLREVCAAVRKFNRMDRPAVVMKDIIIHPIQIALALENKADGVLLNSLVLGPGLEEMLQYCLTMGTEAIVEVHSLLEVEHSLECGATILLVNQWDRTEGRLVPGLALDVKKHIPNEIITIATGGLGELDEMKELALSGYDGVCLGRKLADCDVPYLADKIKHWKLPSRDMLSIQSFDSSRWDELQSLDQLNDYVAPQESTHTHAHTDFAASLDPRLKHEEELFHKLYDSRALSDLRFFNEGSHEKLRIPSAEGSDDGFHPHLLPEDISSISSAGESSRIPPKNGLETPNFDMEEGAFPQLTGIDGEPLSLPSIRKQKPPMGISHLNIETHDDILKQLTSLERATIEPPAINRVCVKSERNALEKRENSSAKAAAEGVDSLSSLGEGSVSSERSSGVCRDGKLKGKAGGSARISGLNPQLSELKHSPGALNLPPNIFNPPSGSVSPPSGSIYPPSGSVSPPSGSVSPPSGSVSPPSGSIYPPQPTDRLSPPDESNGFYVEDKVSEEEARAHINEAAARFFEQTDEAEPQSFLHADEVRHIAVDEDFDESELEELLGGKNALQRTEEGGS